MPQTIRPALFASLGLLALGASPACATDGYFVEGVGARDQSLAGVGSADSKEALTIANNPAGLVDVSRQLNGDVSIFAPNRQYDASGTVLVAPGKVASGRNVFVFPALAYASPLSGDSAFGVGLCANGGMNTSTTTSAAGYAYSYHFDAPEPVVVAKY